MGYDNYQSKSYYYTTGTPIFRINARQKKIFRINDDDDDDKDANMFYGLNLQ